MSVWGHKYTLLARREFWEHRALWMAPAIVGAILVVLPALGRRRTGGPAFQIGGESSAAGMLSSFFGHSTMTGTIMMMGGIACIAVVSYLLDCLYAERRDRSVLFWKSLPVSDAETVLAKVVVALLLVPLLVLMLGAIVHPLVLGVTWLAHTGMRAVIGSEALLAGYRAMAAISALTLFCAMWYAPVAAWLMLVSVLARRLPLMVAVVPVIGAIMLEAMIFDTRHVGDFIGERLAPWTQHSWDFRGLFVGRPDMDWSALYFNTSLWLGLAVAAVMVYIIIRLRKYRDDT